ncbi:MAG: hypothetical protein CBB60_003680 [Armatimonadetes bacterium Cent15-Ar3]|nr:MAG: hypothetical protein CBB60_003680 [Armatimonadetes bacterium Cent15-Ar3]
MDDKLVTALVAGIVSLLVSGIGFASAWFGLRAKRQELERQFGAKYMERLYELRLKEYPVAFQITKGLTVPPKAWKSYQREAILQKKIDLSEWINGTAGLIASADVIRAVRPLISTLGAPYGNGNEYQKAQMQKMISLTIQLRRELRRDVQFLHRSDDSRKRRGEYGEVVEDPNLEVNA